jgi:hypothetical protein
LTLAVAPDRRAHPATCPFCGKPPAASLCDDRSLRDAGMVAVWKALIETMASLVI